MKLAHFLLTKSAEAHDNEIQWAHEYGEPGYDAPAQGIVFGNWNPKQFTPEIPSYSSRWAKLAEASGLEVELEWSDEWGTCGDCGCALRTQPDGWDWTPSYDEKRIEQGEFLCLKCAKDN